MRIDNLLSFAFSRHVTNIEISCNEHIKWFTQWISKNIYILIIIKDFKKYDKKDIVFFEKYTESGKETPYLLSRSPQTIVCMRMQTTTYDLTFTHEYCQLESLYIPSKTCMFTQNSMTFMASILKESDELQIMIHRIDALGEWNIPLAIPIDNIHIPNIHIHAKSHTNSIILPLTHDHLIDHLIEFNSELSTVDIVTKIVTKIYVYDIESLSFHLHDFFKILHSIISNNITLYDLYDCAKLLQDKGIVTDGMNKKALIHTFQEHYQAEILFLDEDIYTPIVPFSLRSVTQSQQLVFIDHTPIKNISIQNRLDCIALSTTSREIMSGACASFLRNLIDTLDKTLHSLDFIIFVNNSEFEISQNLQNILNEIVVHFNSIKIINTDISKDKDIYIRRGSAYPTIIPPLGLTSGPNEQFFTIMNMCKEYNTILLLESDCILKKGWLEKCIYYVDSNGHFLISGAQYDGSYIEYDKSLLNHINGVAFYKSGSPIFQEFLKYLRIFIERYIIYIHFDLAFDIAIYMCVNTYIKHISDKYPYTMLFWRFIKRNIISNTIIINASTKEDIHIPIVYFSELYNYAILHKKI